MARCQGTLHAKSRQVVDVPSSLFEQSRERTDITGPLIMAQLLTLFLIFCSILLVFTYPLRTIDLPNLFLFLSRLRLCFQYPLQPSIFRRLSLPLSLAWLPLLLVRVLVLRMFWLHHLLVVLLPHWLPLLMPTGLEFLIRPLGFPLPRSLDVTLGF